MPGDLDKICAMLEAGSVDLQCAAARVLGELKSSEPAVRKGLQKALKASHDAVRLVALEALAVIDVKEALPHLVPLLGSPDPLRSRAIAILTELGPAAAKALREGLSKGEVRVREGILEILGGIQGVDTGDALLAGLLDSDLDVIRRAAQAYRKRIEDLPAGDRPKELKKLLAFMDSPKVRKIRTPLASCLTIVGAIGDPSAAKPVLAYLDRKQPPAVRAQALATLASLTLSGKDAKGVASKVFPLLSENDLVKPALEVLQKLPLGKEETDRAIGLLKSPHSQVRLFAMKALGSAGSPKAAGILIEALWDPDRGVSETAAASLRTNSDFVPLLVKALEGQKDPQKGWRIANLLRTYRNILDKATVKKFVAKSVSMAGTKEPGFQVYFEIARAAAPEALRDGFLKKGRGLVRKNPDEAERVLRHLEREELATAETGLALAIARLRLQRKDLAFAGRDRGPAMFLFSKLAHLPDFSLAQAVQRSLALLEPDDLLYLGFSLIERQGPERDAGAEVLKFVAKKFGSRETGRIARQKLKTQGAG